MPAPAGTKPKVVVSRIMPTDLLHQAAKRGVIELVCWPHDRVCDRTWLLENVKGAAGAVVMLTDKVDKEFIEAAGDSLKVISTMSVGYDHVDLQACKEKGIRVGHTPEVLDDAVADLTLMLALMATRRAGEALNIVRDGKWAQTGWSPLTLCGPSIADATIGFYGFGRCAQKTAYRLLALGPSRILYTVSSPRPFSSKVSPVLHPLVSGANAAFSQVEIANEPDLKTLAAKCDVLFVMTSLSPQTKHTINKEVLGCMKSKAVLVNTARGPVVDTDALVQALREGKLGAAGLDVVEGEPNIPADHPLLCAPLNDKVVMLPHIGSATIETRVAMSTLTVRNLFSALGLGEGGSKAGQMEHEVVL